jgi:hypothetical protein
MTVEDVVAKMKEWLDYRNGQDYYDYSGNPHWYGDEDDLEGFAAELLQDLNKDKSPT